MTAIIGERDTLIMSTVPRYAAPIDRDLHLTASSTTFEVSLTGQPTPATITFSALMLGAVGEITFSSEPPVALTVANGDAVLKFEDMTSSIVTVTATTVIDGLTYIDRQTVDKRQALDLRPPPAPTGLVTTGQPAAIRLNWAAAPANYANLDYTEIWRAGVNDFGQAAPVGRADGREFTDPVGPGKTLYYWIRYVSRAAIPGPFNNSTGTVGASAAEVQHLLEVLTGQIRHSQLFTDLGEKIDLIDDLVLAVGDTVGAAVSASQAAQSATNASGSAASANSAAGVATQAANLAGQSAGAAVQSSQSASSAATNAAGSASSAATAVLQAQAILSDPVTGLVNQVAVVKQTLETTASTLNGVAAKYSVQMDVDGVVGGLEVLGGGGRIDFGVRASGFFIAGPAGSAVPSAVPFIVRTTETVVGGVTIPIGVYIADAFIQNASITNAKIGGDIWSSNWAPGANGSGWYLQRTGDFYANSVRLRGNIAGGTYTGYAWPPNNGTGYYLGPEGLLLGNPSTGRYIQLESDGTLHAPGLSIEGGRASFSGNVNTGMGAGFRIEMGPDDPVYAMWAGAGTKNDTNAIFYLKRSGAGYFGGALSAGILRTSVTNPTLDANSQVTDGPFGTNGGPITVVCSYSYSEEAGRDGGTYSASGPENSATIQLYRTIRDTAEELVQTFSVTGATYIQNNGVFDELSFYQRVIEGSITYTDTVGGSQDRTFRAVLVTRSLRTITFNPMPGGIGQSMSNIRQSLSLISTE
ncbi:phage tail tip fiber protein [Duganella phyllosphaerae]|uniref:Tip attachment protein J central straight fiber domain-containing protein n=1 Tax=Duganella phyllosphaerae TaxID=762836 RepID=A0A1E7W4P3_9BURK|nr:hypothetical protein [Duganella phyllosphaerae]OEZ90730.1 hypothetical protein DUPY_53370 [Duganella phyllosphaerae]